MIFEGDEGFDMTFCQSGMWGIANYFAFNASYSHNYRHDLPNGQKQMFVANVIMGKEKIMPSTPSLRMPPLIEGSNLRYDCVQGNTNGSDVVMIYANKKAYPQFLITYV